MVDIISTEEIHPSMKRRDPEDVQLLLTEKFEGTRGSYFISDFTADLSLIRTGTREDWFVANRSDNLEFQETKQTILCEGNLLSSERDHFHMEESKRASYFDDFLMVQSRPAIDDHGDLEWKTDISMLADLTMSSPSDAAPNVSHASGTQETADLAERTAACGLTCARSKTVITGSKTASGKLETHSVPKTVNQLKKTSVRAASLVNALTLPDGLIQH